MRKAAVLLISTAMVILLSGYGCQRAGVVTPGQEGSRAQTNKQTNKCQALKEEIEEGLKKINYCQADSDCVYVGEVYCPFGCYFLHSQNEKFSGLREKMNKYNLLCGQCRIKCPVFKNQSPHCAAGKCVLPGE